MKIGLEIGTVVTEKLWLNKIMVTRMTGNAIFNIYYNFLRIKYITVDGKPLFIIYKPDLIIDIYEMVKYFRQRIVEEGFPGICLAFQFPTYYADMFYRDDIFDYMIEFEPVIF